jgi:pyruvate/2-oxoglutarate dehydrogenase complex dihydrolipoamide acyltransferase (E2) component
MKKRRKKILTKREIDKELNKIYQERRSWSAINKQIHYKIPEKETIRRHLVTFAQYTLYKVEDAKKEKNKMMASFNFRLYEIIREYVGLEKWQRQS